MNVYGLDMRLRVEFEEYGPEGPSLRRRKIETFLERAVPYVLRRFGVTLTYEVDEPEFLRRVEQDWPDDD
jgi:hypothetical protein